MNEKNGNQGKQRRAAPAKQDRTKEKKNTNTSLNLALLNGPNEIKPHWFITPLLVLSVASTLLPRAAAMRSVMNNNTSMPHGDQPLSLVNNSSDPNVSVVNPSQKRSR